MMIEAFGGGAAADPPPGISSQPCGVSVCSRRALASLCPCVLAWTRRAPRTPGCVRQGKPAALPAFISASRSFLLSAMTQCIDPACQKYATLSSAGLGNTGIETQAVAWSRAFPTSSKTVVHVGSACGAVSSYGVVPRR